MADENSETISAQDLFFYAPIGAVFTAKDMLPTLLNTLASRGKSQVDNLENVLNNSYVLARSMGQMRVNQAQEEGRKQADKVREAAEGGLKLVQDMSKQAQSVAQTAAQTATVTAQTAAKSAQAAASTVIPGAAKAPDAPTANISSQSREPAKSSAAPVDLAIPNYDTLSAVNVSDRLGGLGPDELEAIRGYEASHKSRKTVIGKIDSLLDS